MRAPDYDPANRPVETVNYHIGTKRYRFVPSGVTPKNIGVLLPLLVALISAKSVGQFDFERYIDEHGLWPCFEYHDG